MEFYEGSLGRGGVLPGEGAACCEGDEEIICSEKGSNSSTKNSQDKVKAQKALAINQPSTIRAHPKTKEVGTAVQQT